MVLNATFNNISVILWWAMVDPPEFELQTFDYRTFCTCFSIIMIQIWQIFSDIKPRRPSSLKKKPRMLAISDDEESKLSVPEKNVQGM